MNPLVNYKWYSERRLIRTVISVYFIGAIGFLFPVTHDFFLSLTPLNLLFSLAVLFVAVWRDLKLRHALIFLIIYLLGYFIEVIGVNTGWPFGEYTYGDVLLVKVYETPLFIGINWLLLVLASHLMARHRMPYKWLVPVAGAFMMLIFDVALEPFAIGTGMWTWAAKSVPIENYLAWWVIAFVLHLVMNFVPFSRGHKVATTVFLAQIIFFIIVNISNFY